VRRKGTRGKRRRRNIRRKGNDVEKEGIMG
jgi:hypothetical protein